MYALSCMIGPCPGTIARRIDRDELIHRLDPLGRITVINIMDRLDDEIAGNHNLLPRQIDNGVSIGIASSQKFDLEFALSEIDREIGRVSEY